MKCWKCHTTMVKDEDSRTATCPCCGRTVGYRTKSEKKWDLDSSYSSYSSYSGDGGNHSGISCSGCVLALAIGVLIIIGLLLLLVWLIFGGGLWTFLKSAAEFIINLLWSVISFVFEGLWWILSGLFNLIF